MLDLISMAALVYGALVASRPRLLSHSRLIAPRPSEVFRAPPEIVGRGASVPADFSPISFAPGEPGAAAISAPCG